MKQFFYYYYLFLASFFFTVGIYNISRHDELYYIFSSFVCFAATFNFLFAAHEMREAIKDGKK